MNRRITWILAATVVQLALFVATLWLPGLGGPSWHHLVSLGLALAPLPFFWRPLTRSRMVLGLGVFVTTVLALASGFFILYWKPWLKAHVLVDWIKWWHVYWSWLSIVFFVLHTWINRVAYLHFWRGMHRQTWPAILHHGSLVAVLVAIPLTWSDWGRRTFVDATYITSTWIIWLALVAPAYALWWGAVAGRTRSSLSGLTATLSRARVRPFVDVALIPATILANVSGFPITFWKAEVHGNGFKYVGKIWHTAPSIVMAILIFAHTVHLWRPLARHWRRYQEGARAPVM